MHIQHVERVQINDRNVEKAFKNEKCIQKSMRMSKNDDLVRSCNMQVPSRYAKLKRIRRYFFRSDTLREFKINYLQSIQYLKLFKIEGPTSVSSVPFLPICNINSSCII